MSKIREILDATINKHLHYNVKIHTILITELSGMKEELEAEIKKLIESYKVDLDLYDGDGLSDATVGNMLICKIITEDGL